MSPETAGTDDEVGADDGADDSGREVARQMSGALPADDEDDARRRAISRRKLFADTPPPRIGRFVVDERLGAGAMGTVYRAHDDVLDRRVAIKVLRGELGDKASERMLREARGLARLTHTNVVTVYEVGEVDGQPYVAMEYVEGQTLGDWQRGRDVQSCLAAYLEAARGLAAVHGAGLVHRDFKPANVLVGDDGRIRVADFGLVRREDTGTRTEPDAEPVSESDSVTDPVPHVELTLTGSVLGTPAYMSPEQLLGKVADARSDQFSFCVALYEAVSGRRPFGDGSPGSGPLADMKLGPPSMAHLPAVLGRVLARGLQLEPADRWPDMDALMAALSATRELARRRSRRGRVLVVSALSAAVAGAVWVGLGAASRGEERQRAAVAQAQAQLAVDPTASALILEEVDPATPGWVETARTVLTSALTRRTLRPSGPLNWIRLDASRGLLAGRPDGSVVTIGPAGEEVMPPWWQWLASDRVSASDAALKTLERETGGSLDLGWATVAEDGAVEALGSAEAASLGGPAMLMPGGTGVLALPAEGVATFRPVPGAAVAGAAVAGAEVAGSDVAGSEVAQPAAPVPLAQDVRVMARGRSVVALGQEDGLVVLWDGHARTELRGMGPTPQALAVSPRQDWVVGAAGGKARAWQLAGRQAVLDLPGDLSPRGLRFLGDYDVLLLDARRGASLVDLPSQRVAPLLGHTREVLLATTASGDLATYALDGTVRVWDLWGLEGQVLGRAAARVWSGSLDASGRWLATAGADGVVRLFDLTGVVPSRDLLGHTDRAYHTAFSPDGSRLASGSADGAARIWRLDRPGEPPVVLPGHQGWAYALAFSPDGTLLATGDKAGNVRVFRADGTGEGRLLGVYDEADRSLRVHSVAFASDGQAVISCAKFGAVTMWPLDGGEPVPLPGHSLDPAAVVLGSGEILTVGGDGLAQQWTPAGERVAAWPHDSPIVGWAHTDARSRFAVARADGSVQIWELGKSGEPVWRLPRSAAVYERVAFDREGTRLALGDTDGRVTVYTLPETTPRWRFGGHSSDVRFLAFHGADVVSASFDGTVRRWQAPESPQALMQLLRDRTRDCLAADQRAEWLGESESAAEAEAAACREHRPVESWWRGPRTGP